MDWPTIISRLQQRVYDAPNRGEARQQLAVAYNNYGVGLGNQGDWVSAARQLQEAIRIEPENTSYRHNLANIRLQQAAAAYQQHQIVEALEALDEAVTLNTELAQAYALRGRIEYDRQKLKEAKAAWQRALQLNPAQPELAAQLQQLEEELPVESKFERVAQGYFDLRYEEQVDRPVGFDIRDALFEARRLVGSDFAYWPTRKIVVLIYSAESFRKLRQETPEWVSGQFDGKIRVPLPSAQMDHAMVRNILFHEYTHALVHDLSGGQCPVWLNEGLAEFQGRSQLAGPLLLVEQAGQQQRLLPWESLSSQISVALPKEQVGLGYEESYTVVAYLAERFGFWRFRRMLKAIKGGAEWKAAMEDEYNMKLPRIEQAWLQWLPQFLTRRAH